jgi:PKD repeat protein
MKKIIIFLCLTLFVLPLFGQITRNQKLVQSKLSLRLPSSVGLAANAGKDFTCYVGEAVRLDGSASVGYLRESQSDGTPSIAWDMGDGNTVENLITAPHAYLAAGTYKASLTVKNSSGASANALAVVTVLPITPYQSQTVFDSGNPNTNRDLLQSAIDSASLNCETNEILVPAGFTANDPIVLPTRECKTYLTIRVTSLGELPANVRVTKSDAGKLFTINARSAATSGYNQAIIISPSANYFRFIGLRLMRSGQFKNDIIAVDTDSSVQPSHLIFDRILIDGNGTETNRAFSPNGRSFSLLNSSILDIKAIGYESKAIGQWRGNGPLAVVNNRLEAASINSLIGGATVTSSDEILHGYEFRSNYVWKSPDWVVSDGVGKGYAVKNLFELKCGFYVAAVGNIFENNYADGQSGEAVLMKSAAQPNESNVFAEVSGVDFRNNKILNTRAGFSVVGVQSTIAPHPPDANHIFFTNNFWQERGDRGNLILTPDYFEINHNTFTRLDVKSQWVAIEQASPGGGPHLGKGLKILNSLTFDGLYGSIFSSYGVGVLALNYGFAFWDVRGNYFPGQGSSNPAGNYSVMNSTVNGVDGHQVGVDLELLTKATLRAEVGNGN